MKVAVRLNFLNLSPISYEFFIFTVAVPQTELLMLY